MAGRAATMMRSPFCRPLVFSSRSTKPVGRPVTSSLRLRELVDGAEALLDDLADADEALADAVLRDVEDRLLRAVQDQRRLVLRLVARLHDAVAGVDQVPEDRLLLDDPAPVLDVGDARHAVRAGRPGRRRRPPPPAPTPATSSSLRVTRSMGWLRSARAAMASKIRRWRLAVEVVAGEDLGRGVEGGVVHQDRAQDGPLRLGVVGQRLFFGDELGGHGILDGRAASLNLERALSRDRSFSVRGPARKDRSRDLEHAWYKSGRVSPSLDRARLVRAASFPRAGALELRRRCGVCLPRRCPR